jgi:hypothetical protein
MSGRLRTSQASLIIQPSSKSASHRVPARAGVAASTFYRKEARVRSATAGPGPLRDGGEGRVARLACREPSGTGTAGRTGVVDGWERV